jgi:two-component sensor histidine kinase
MPQFSGLVNVPAALVTWCLARLAWAGKVCGMTDSSSLPDSTPIPQVPRRRVLGIRLRHWRNWLFALLTLISVPFMIFNRESRLPAGSYFGYGLAFDLLVLGVAAAGIAAWAAYFERRALMRLGIDADLAYDQNIFRADQSHTFTVATNNAAVMQRAEDALIDYGAIIVSRDDVAGSVVAVTSLSSRGAGERIEVAARGSDPCEVSVHAASRFMPKFSSDFGRSWEHVHAISTRILTGEFPAWLPQVGPAKTALLDAVDTPPIFSTVGAWQRVLLFCAIFSTMFLSLFQTSNVGMVTGAFALGVSLELFAYFKFRAQVQNKMRTEVQESFEVALSNLWPALWVCSFWVDVSQGWLRSHNIGAVAMFVTIGYFGVSILSNKKRDRAQRVLIRIGREKAELEHQLAEAKLVALSAQIEPHFLFNTLASIQYLIRNDSGKASEMTSDLIRYLRLALPRMKQATARLADELELVRAYLGIMQIRMGTRLQFAIDSPDELADVQIPTMTLITLVENAIKHGLEQKADGGMISLMARKGIHGSGTLRLTVADTGGGFSTAVTGTGIGLANIRERLDNLYRGNAKLELEANQPSGVKAILILPMERT